KATDCTAAYHKLRELERQLRSLEYKFELEAGVEIPRDEWINMWHESFFTTQKILPESARRSAEEAFNNRLSVVQLDGDRSSHVEGVIYNVTIDAGVPFAVTRDTYK